MSASSPCRSAFQKYLREGTDITLVTYGASCRIATDAAQDLEALGVSLEVVDVQSLLPFDIHHKLFSNRSRRRTGLFLWMRIFPAAHPLT